jgi:hypothetical protein
MARSDRKVVSAIEVDKNYATYPCGERITLDAQALPLKVAKGTYRVTRFGRFHLPQMEGQG